MRASATIRDVARVAEVHPGTVSRALNPETRALVNVDTAARVLAAADELGYRPNPIARGLKTQRSYTVGVLIPDLLNPLFPPIVRGVDDRLAKDGYTPLLVNTDRDLEREQASVETMLARQVDGFIAATARLDMEPLVAASAEGVPVVLVNRSIEDGSLASVTVDDRTGIGLAVEHVVALGHERVAHVAGPQNVSTGRLRLIGFRDAMAGHGLGAPAERVAIGESFAVEAGAEACAQVLAADAGVTAIIAANDLLALGCYAALTELGLRCPEDVSVVGFNDMLFVDKLQPPLTTVRVPQRELGFVAADLLLEQIGGEVTGPREIVLDPSLVIRDSTAPPA